MKKTKFWGRIILAIIAGGFFFFRGLIWMVALLGMTEELMCNTDPCVPLSQTWWRIIICFLMILVGMAFIKGAWDKWYKQARMDHEAKQNEEGNDSF